MVKGKPKQLVAVALQVPSYPDRANSRTSTSGARADDRCLNEAHDIVLADWRFGVLYPWIRLDHRDNWD